MIPPSKLPEFSKAYFDMFVRYDNGAGRVFLDRRDTQVGQPDLHIYVFDLSESGGVFITGDRLKKQKLKR